MKNLRLNKVEKIAQAVLFASGEPVAAARMAQVLECDIPVAYSILDRVRDYYDEEDGALEVVLLNESYQLCTRETYAPQIRAALEIRRNQPLSQAAMEALAIIAYNQPVTKSFVEQVRGVDSGSVVNTLVEKGLVEEHGRLELPGKPVAYVTTHNFLRSFGLGSLDQLPVLPADKLADDAAEGQLEGQVRFEQAAEFAE